MISKHVSYKEGTRSFTALRLGIDNEPTGVPSSKHGSPCRKRV